MKADGTRGGLDSVERRETSTHAGNRTTIILSAARSVITILADLSKINRFKIISSDKIKIRGIKSPM
jgi:hypothetical protein